ncbi:MAG: PKD domain-containing protein, partial [Halobacteriales archaeon]
VTRTADGSYAAVGFGDATGFAVGLRPPNRAPRAAFEIRPSRPRVDERVTFDASDASDPDGEIRGYAWDVGADGSVERRGEQVSYTFDTAGTVPVRLQVTDEGGATDTVTTRVPVAFAFRERDAKEQLAGRVDDYSVLTDVESLTGASLRGDPELAAETLDALENAVTDGRLDREAAREAFQRHYAAEDGIERILSLLGPNGAATNLAEVTARYTVEALVGLVLLVVAVKLTVGAAGYAITVQLNDAIGFLLGRMTPNDGDSNFSRKMREAVTPDAERLLENVVDGSITSADALAGEVDDLVDGVVDTVRDGLRAWVELESYNAVLEATKPAMGGLAGGSTYGSLRDLDESLQPTAVEEGLPGETDVAVESVADFVPRVTEAIRDTADAVEGFGSIAGEISLYDNLYELLTDEEFTVRDALGILADLVTQVVDVVFSTAASFQGLLSFALIKASYAEMTDALLEGRPVVFDHV